MAQENSSGFELSYLPAEDKQSTIEEISVRDDFLPLVDPDVNLGRKKGEFWFKVEINRLSSEKNNLLGIEYALIDYIDFFTLGEDGWKVIKTGSQRPYDSRLIPHRHFWFSISKEGTYFFKIKSQNPLKLPFSLKRGGTFFQNEMGTQLTYGLFIGFMLLVCVINLVFFLFLRERYFLSYVLYMLATLFVNIFLSGHIFSLIGTSYEGWQNNSFLISFNLTLLFALLFLQSFLEVKKTSKFHNTALMLVFFLNFSLLIVGLFTGYVIINTFLELETLLFIGYVLFLGIKSLRAGNRPARFFVLAYVVYLVLVIPIILISFAVVEKSFLTQHGAELAAVFEAVFLCIALADRYHFEREENLKQTEKAQLETVRVQKEANEKLEEQVTTRTKELQKANTELSEKNEIVLAKNQEIDLKNQALERVNKNKDKLFSILAHDVRSPLNSLISFTSLLENGIGNLSEIELQKLGSGLNSRVKHLHTMLDNLLAWSQAQLGGIQLDIHSVELRPISQRVEALLLPLAEQKGLAIHNEIVDQTWIMADVQALETVLRNLVANAIKFTMAGGKVTIYSEMISKESIEVSVKDTGVGMSKEALERIFHFEEGRSKPGTSGEKGTGLGLMICNEFIQELGGGLKVESQEGKGTRFSFVLPIGTPIS